MQLDTIIDLKKANRGKVNVDLSWEIPVDNRIGFFWDRFPFIKKNQRVDRVVYLSIDNLTIPEALTCDKDNLISIVYEMEEHLQKSLPVEVHLTQKVTSFQVFFNMDGIKDCKESQQRTPKTYAIEFDVIMKDSDSAIIDKEHVKINIRFAVLDIKPHVEFDLLKVSKKGISYSSQTKEFNIGSLVSWTEEEFAYTPDVYFNQIQIGLFDEKKDLSNLIYFKIGGSQCQSIKFTQKPSKKLLQRFPIYLDVASIGNPIEEVKKFTISLRAKYSFPYSPEIIQPMTEKMEEIIVLRDGQSAELKVWVGDEVDKRGEYISNGSVSHFSRYDFTPHTKMQRLVKVRLQNMATDSSTNNAGVVIRNLKINDTVTNNVRITNDKDDVIKEFSTVVGDNRAQLSSVEGLFLANGNNSQSILNVLFNPYNIADVIDGGKDCEFSVETWVSFDYYENKKGQAVSEKDFMPFRFCILWSLRLLPYPDWLCVDYGTSAIVCKYGNKILDLRAQKENIFDDEKNRYDSRFTEDDLEIGTKFLSSDIIFHTLSADQTLSSLCSEQPQKEPYGTLAICLSPTSSLIIDNVSLQLPCLKILVGNEYLPENEFYETYRYTRYDKSGTVSRTSAEDAKKAGEKNSLLLVSNIFEEAYNELFRYFVSPIIGENKKRIKKLVLTYPNTYTPVNIKVLRGIAENAFPYIREGYLQFVSESDAVAAYYIANWSKFNPAADIKAKETALVYDMGAGTLDITVIEKSLSTDGKLIIDVKGKIGTGKAGNYLDYVIADILQDLNLTPTGIVSTRFVSNAAELNDRVALKWVVKNEIKPKLITGHKIKIKLSKTTQEINSDVILTSPKFQTFLDDVTTKMLNQLVRYLGKDDFTIDTVILSGRSCRLQPLRQALEKSIRRIVKRQVKMIEFGTNSDEAKTIVVDGAVAQVAKFSIPTSNVQINSRRLYASYGVVYQQLGGRMKFVELVNHNEIPFVNQTTAFEGKNIKIKGTASSESLWLVQTYMSEKDTDICINNSNYDFISVMEEYNMEDYHRADELNVSLHLDSDNNISLFVNGLVAMGSMPKGVDLTSETTKRSIWPVTIFDKEKEL